MGSQKTDPLWVIPPPVESTLDRFLRPVPTADTEASS
jgi:hypothetical protein